MIKKYIFLFFILLINNVSGYTLMTNTYQTNLGNVLSLSDYNIDNQYLISIPYDVISNINIISSYKLQLYKNTSNNIDDKLYIRIYYDYGNGLILHEALNIPNNFNLDYGSFLLISFNDLNINSDIKKVAIGLYSDGTWQLFNLNSIYNDERFIDLFNTTIPNSCYESGQTNYQCIYNNLKFFNSYESITDSNNNPINSKYTQIYIYGIRKFPDTPIPTPTSTIIGGNGTINPDIPINIIPDESSNISDFFPDFNQSILCDLNNSCNQTKIIPDGISPTDSTSGKFLKSLGYCSGDSCTIYDFIDLLYDYSIIIFYISIFLILYKFVLKEVL